MDPKETPFPHNRPAGVFHPSFEPMRFQAAHLREHREILVADDDVGFARRFAPYLENETRRNQPLPMSDPEHDPQEAVPGKPAATGTLAPTSRLSADLAALRCRAAGKSLTVDELTKELEGRGFAMLLLLLADRKSVV